ncbi:MAG: SUMF1/EgtB/PvdO family nonheme iron enzyme [Nitrospirota bacterium]
MPRQPVLSLIAAGLLLASLAPPALADTRGVFVSPATGVSVGSVWGVFIGVSKYQQKELNLKYADKDAQALHDFFVKQFKGRIPADQFRLVTNEQATRGRILKEVSEVLRLAQPEDLVILSLAQHGLPDASGHDLYFLTYNSDANLPEDQGISRDDLLKQIARSKARKIVLFLDACHAGAFGASSTLLAMRNANAADINRMLVSMGQAQDGIAVLSASSAAERSQEGPQFCGGHGAFTCALLTGLKGAADNDGNGLVQMRELYDHTYREVKRLTTGYQNPEIQGRYDNSLPLAATGKGAPPPSPQTGPAPTGVDLSGYHDLEAVAARAEQREQAWGKVQAFAGKTSVSREKRLAALDKFLADFPDDNPHAAEAEALKQQVHAEVLVAKAPAYEAPRQMGKEITGRDGAPMVLVPAGEFIMGSNDGDADEKPERRVTLEAFYIDKYEVSTKLYATFIQDTRRAQPSDWSQQVALVGSGDRPVVNVTWHDADAYCRHYGKRLPTEQEWEKAARGTDGRKYPWGNEEPSSRHALFNTRWNGYGTLATVESYEAGKSPYGLYHMAGNVWEWTSSDYDNSTKVLRGGSWHNNAGYVRSAYRSGDNPSRWNAGTGFRCAQDAR